MPQAFWDTIQRMQNMAIQPLDLLPPVDVTFSDYALAVLRAEEIANPTDPDDYRGDDARRLHRSGNPARRTIDRGSRSRTNIPASRPRMCSTTSTMSPVRAPTPTVSWTTTAGSSSSRHNADIAVADLCTAQKLTREARRQPKQVLLQYIWREDVVARGRAVRAVRRTRSTSLLCGERSRSTRTANVLAWARKPGTQALARRRQGRRRGEQAEGEQRRDGVSRSARPCGSGPGGSARDRRRERPAGQEHRAADVTDGRRRASGSSFPPFRDPRRRGRRHGRPAHGR